MGGGVLLDLLTQILNSWAKKRESLQFIQLVWEMNLVKQQEIRGTLEMLVIHSHVQKTQCQVATFHAKNSINAQDAIVLHVMTMLSL